VASKHKSAPWFLKQGFFEGIKSFKEFEARTGKLADTVEMGDALEILVEAYLHLDKVLNAKDVWVVGSIPLDIRKALNLPNDSKGIDGVYEDQAGNYIPYQVKYRTNMDTLPYGEISPFLGITEKSLQDRLIFTNCRKLAVDVANRTGVRSVRADKFNELTEADFKRIHAWLTDKKVEPFKPWDPLPHQREAIEKITAGLKEADRTTAVMACGTGKTLVALWAAEAQQPKTVLVLVPSLALLSQTLPDWCKQTSWGERFHWYSSTGWVMWNAQVAGLLNGVTCVIYDGNPGGSKDNPDWGILWRMAAQEKVSFFGAGAAFFANCQKAGVDIMRCGDQSAVRAQGTTGSPLSPETQSWGTAQFQAIGTDIWWCNISGGTDFAGAFLGGHRELPQEPGVMQCRELGCAVEAWNEAGEPVLGEVGELICAQPIPSMPLYFWNDKDNARYLASYFEMYPAGHGRQPGGGNGSANMGGVWRHGDWLRIGDTQGVGEGCVIFGRSDATINRYGLRMGTSELYSAVEALPEVMDSMVVDLEYLGKESYMPLFVVLRPGTAFDDAIKAKLNNAIKVALSPRFIPNEIFQVAEIPRTLSGKKQELPIKKLMLGQPLEKVVNRDAMANPGCLDWYVDLAKVHLAKA
jgi:acyl-CoA synthetase (AMP-forming)/AMP-acid ligase II